MWQPSSPELLQSIVSLGQRRGYVAAAEIFTCLPEIEDDPEALAWVLDQLDAADVDVIGLGGADSEDTGLDRLVDFRPASLDGIDSDDTVSLYFREVGSIPLLTKDEEVALAKRIERGQRAYRRAIGGSPAPDSATERELEHAILDGEAAYAHLVKANSRLVISMAKRYRGQGVPFLDLIQEGNVGLMRAAEKFEYRRGFKFSTYATWWVRQAITRALANQGRTIRVPVHMSDRIRKLFAISQRLEQDLGRRPTLGEIADRMQVSEDKVREMLKISRHNLSLEKPVGEEQDSELGFFLADESAVDPLEEASHQLLQQDLEDLLMCLTAREARIVRLRFGLENGRPHTLKEVGRKFQLTRERIRQIEQEALAKLRQPERQARLSSYLG